VSRQIGRLLALALAGLLAGCPAAGDDGRAATRSLPATPTLAARPTGGAATMTASIQKGPLPPNFAMKRDTDPLPPGALVKFQAISRGPRPAGNHRWLLYDDGRLFLARHSGAADSDRLPFDTPLPDAPTLTLPRERVAEVERRLREARFAGEPPYQVNPSVQDGAYFIVTARLDGAVHEVIYEAYAPPLVEFLGDIPPRS
jgi:hypothetical protein